MARQRAHDLEVVRRPVLDAERHAGVRAKRDDGRLCNDAPLAVGVCGDLREPAWIWALAVDVTKSAPQRTPTARPRGRGTLEPNHHVGVGAPGV